MPGGRGHRCQVGGGIGARWEGHRCQVGGGIGARWEGA